MQFCFELIHFRSKLLKERKLRLWWIMLSIGYQSLSLKMPLKKSVYIWRRFFHAFNDTETESFIVRALNKNQTICLERSGYEAMWNSSNIWLEIPLIIEKKDIIKSNLDLFCFWPPNTYFFNLLEMVWCMFRIRSILYSSINFCFISALFRE